MRTTTTASKKSSQAITARLNKGQSGSGIPVFGKIGIPALAAVLAIRSASSASDRRPKQKSRR